MNEAHGDLFNDISAYVNAPAAVQEAAIVSPRPTEILGTEKTPERRPVNEFLVALNEEVKAIDGPVREWRPYFPQEADTPEQRFSAFKALFTLKNTYFELMRQGRQDELTPSQVIKLFNDEKAGLFRMCTLEQLLGSAMHQNAKNWKLVEETYKPKEQRDFKGYEADIGVPPGYISNTDQYTEGWRAHENAYWRLVQRLYRANYFKPPLYKEP